ncbi:MAG: hypothetical protein ABI840_01605, partial [bacterium]
TIKVELRNPTSPFAVADQSVMVCTTGGTVQLKFTNANDGNYYLALKHRNSIETWSNTAIALSRTTPVNFNFTSSASQAYGNNMKQIDASPLRFGIYSGDVNQDGTVDLADLSLIDNDAGNFVSGYFNTDVNGDDFVDLSDLTIADNNAANFVSIMRP